MYPLNITRDEVCQYAQRLCGAAVSDATINRVMLRLEQHYSFEKDPAVTQFILQTFLEDELKAISGHVRNEAIEGAKVGAAEGAKTAAQEGAADGTKGLTNSILNLSTDLREWLDKGFLELKQNTRVMREIDEKIGKGKGITLRVENTTLTPEAYQAVIQAIPEATVRAIAREQWAPLRRANLAIIALMAVIILLFSFVTNDLWRTLHEPRLTKDTVRYAASLVATDADEDVGNLLAGQNIAPSSQVVPRTIAIAAAKQSANHVAEVTLNRSDRWFVTASAPPWHERLLTWATSHEFLTIVCGALMFIAGIYAGKGWR